MSTKKVVEIRELTIKEELIEECVAIYAEHFSIEDVLEFLDEYNMGSLEDAYKYPRFAERLVQKWTLSFFNNEVLGILIKRFGLPKDDMMSM